MNNELPANEQDAPSATTLDLLQVLINAVVSEVSLRPVSVHEVRRVEITQDGLTLEYGSPTPLSVTVERWTDLPIAAPAASDPASDPAFNPTFDSNNQGDPNMSFDADDAIIQAATYLVPVTPIAPTVDENVITIPVKEGVVYLQGDTEVTGTVEITEGQSVTITAAATAGYELSGTASWTFAHTPVE